MKREEKRERERKRDEGPRKNMMRLYPVCSNEKAT
jgi:hypothetical protein